MGWRAVTVTSPLVVIQSGQPGTGLFVYNGTPGPGNPPQLAIVAPGVTQDPFGNAVTSSKILLQGNIITESSGIFRTSASAPLIQLDGPHDAVFIYDASANLTETMAPAATNDGLGHTVYAGIVNYNTALTEIVQMLGGTFNFGSPAQIALTSSKQPGSVGMLAATEGTAEISTGVNGATDTAATLLLWSLNAGGGGQPFVQLQTALELSSNTPPSQQGDTIIYDNANAFPQMLPGNVTGDTTVYKIGHRAFWSTTDQLINSTTFATVCGSAVIGTGAYRVRAVLQVAQGTVSDVNKFRLGFTGTISQVRMGAKFVGLGGVANSVFAVNTTANNGALNPPAFAPNALYLAEFEGIIITTSSGTLSIQAAETTLGDTFTVLALSFFEISPAN